MTENPDSSVDDLLKGPSAEIATLRGMGITNSAIVAYVKRIREGKNKEEALLALLRGRSLNEQQVSSVRETLEQLPAGVKTSSIPKNILTGS